MIKVLFVCHGNICRSTMAEFVFKDMVSKAGIADDFHIESAATSREELGNDTDPRTKRKLDENGIPYTKRRARQMTKEDYESFDYIIGMDDANIRNIIRIVGEDAEHKISKLAEFAGKDKSIADPWYTGNFDITYDDVVEGCTGLLEYFRRVR
ncbi:MAG: low molecular weight protein-tyrosine-phosphatase [Anaerovoracaceae bacterium]|nr:low molecular weight protein-tyrosine-phosphatase [Anaerovoracaceae bacterium]